MRILVLLIALGSSACEREPQSEAEVRPTDTLQAIVPAHESKPAPLVAMPKDQAKLDSMILAGYTPHGDHLHAPGVKECPLNRGREAVM